MGQSAIDNILAERREKNDVAETNDEAKFYSVLSAEGYQENFLEIRFQDGLRTCFAYSDLNWFNYDPDEGTLDIEFGGFLISILGRGLGEHFFHAVKAKKMAWVKEADSDFEDHEDNEVFVEKILISPPEGFGGETEPE